MGVAAEESHVLTHPIVGCWFSWKLNGLGFYANWDKGLGGMEGARAGSPTILLGNLGSEDGDTIQESYHVELRDLLVDLDLLFEDHSNRSTGNKN